MNADAQLCEKIVATTYASLTPEAIACRVETADALITLARQVETLDAAGVTRLSQIAA
jgi:hypothetical protein